MGLTSGFWIVLTTPLAISAAMLMFLVLRRWIPALRVIGSPVEQSALRRAEIAENELERANATIDTLETKNAQLERERSLAAVIELVEKVSLGVDQTLAKLAHLNGGLKHTAQLLEKTNSGMETSTKAIELLASQIIIDVRGDRK